MLLYEMLTGLPPYYDENTNEMYRKILSEPLHFPGPEIVPPAAKDLLERLLNRRPEERLGAKGPSEIKNHPFFHSIDWRKLLERKYDPSFKPNVVSEFQLEPWRNPLLSDASRLTRSIPRTLIVSSPQRPRQTHMWTAPCFLRRCNNNSKAGLTIVLSQVWGMQAEASKILLSGVSQGKGPHDEIRVVRATLFDGRSKIKFLPALAACSLHGGVDIHYIEMNLRRSKSRLYLLSVQSTRILRAHSAFPFLPQL